MNSTKSLNDILNLEGTFYWSYRDEYFIETKEGNFVWSCPSQFGDNSFRRYGGTLKQWCKENEVPCTKNKGKKIIRTVVSDEVIIL